MIVATLSLVADVPSLAARWQALEARADGSFFQGWHWTGCLGHERFPDPVLLELRDDDRTVGLALFNRRRGRLGTTTLLLGETGTPGFDSLFIERNGILAEPGAAPHLAAALRAARTAPLGGARLPRRLVLSGVAQDQLDAARKAGGTLLITQTRIAPCIDLAALRRAGIDHAASLSPNTRHQLRRSERRYAALGSLAVRRAGSAAEAHAFLDALAVLHQRSWTGRGRPGAFARPEFGRFHHALIDRAFPDGAIDLLRIDAGERAVGYLYNFRHRGRVCAYQSGFDYAVTDPHQKPGLTCHGQAIALYLREGLDIYDFLGGDDRYKLSLSNAGEALHWIEVEPRPSVRPALRRARALLRAAWSGPRPPRR